MPVLNNIENSIERFSILDIKVKKRQGDVTIYVPANGLFVDHDLYNLHSYVVIRLELYK